MDGCSLDLHLRGSNVPARESIRADDRVSNFETPQSPAPPMVDGPSAGRQKSRVPSIWIHRMQLIWQSCAVLYAPGERISARSPQTSLS